MYFVPKISRFAMILCSVAAILDAKIYPHSWQRIIEIEAKMPINKKILVALKIISMK